MNDSTTPFMNLYELLEVTHNATRKEIRRSYIRQIKRYNPNKNKQNITKYTDIIFAYSILNDKKTKLVYDMLGPAGLELLKSETSKNVLCTLINPTNILLMFMLTFILACTYMSSQIGVFLMVHMQVDYLVTMVTANLALLMAVIHIMVTRLFVRMRSYGCPLPAVLCCLVIFCEIVGAAQAMLLFLWIDKHWAIHPFVVCMPYLAIEIVVCCLLSYTRKRHFLNYALPFMLRMSIIVFWFADFVVFWKAAVVLLIFVQYFITGQMKWKSFMLVSACYTAMAMPYVVICHCESSWWLFLPGALLTVAMLVTVIILETFRRKRLFYKKLKHSIPAKQYLVYIDNRKDTPCADSAFHPEYEST